MNKSILLSGCVATGLMCTALGGDTAEMSAQVYDIKVTVKTTAAKSGKLTTKNPFVTETGTVIYRKQASQTWTGVLWGCSCETLAGKWMESNGSVSGVAIWNSKKPYDIILLDDMTWHVLDAIDSTGKKAELAWTIGEGLDDSTACLTFAGFGTVVASKSTSNDEEAEPLCDERISSASGNVAGWMVAPSVVVSGTPAKYSFCGETDPGTETSESQSIGWAICPCMDWSADGTTAVSGTWTLKYNSTLSKKLSKATSITDVYTKFPSNVKTSVISKIAEIGASEE